MTKLVEFHRYTKVLRQKMCSLMVNLYFMQTLLCGVLRNLYICSTQQTIQQQTTRILNYES